MQMLHFMLCNISATTKSMIYKVISISTDGYLLNILQHIWGGSEAHQSSFFINYLKFKQIFYFVFLACFLLFTSLFDSGFS